MDSHGQGLSTIHMDFFIVAPYFSSQLNRSIYELSNYRFFYQESMRKSASLSGDIIVCNADKIYIRITYVTYDMYSIHCIVLSYFSVHSMVSYHDI